MAESVSLSTSIVATLRKYGTVPVDFLAKVHGRRTSEIREYLESLEREGVIEIKGENVSLSVGLPRKADNE